MTRFVPREKMGKKARRELDSRQRRTWQYSPVTRRVESRKLYNRKRLSRETPDTRSFGFFLFWRKDRCKAGGDCISAADPVYSGKEWGEEMCPKQELVFWVYC